MAEKKTAKTIKLLSASEYADKIVGIYKKNITDHVFQFIQNDKELFREYNSHVRNHGGTVDQQIGKKVKAVFKLSNTGTCKKPENSLTRSYTKH